MSKQDLEPQAVDISSEELVQELEKPRKIEDLPATKILELQIDKNLAELMRADPNIDQTEAAYKLALSYKQVGTYQRIAEQPMFGPKDFERFDKPVEIKKKLPEIRTAQKSCFAHLGQIPGAKVVHEDSWLHYINGSTGPTEVRIYLSPAIESTPEIFQALADNIPAGSPLKMKTFDENCGETDMSRLDKIVIYCSRNNFDAVWQTVQDVYNQHSLSFKDRVSPGGGTVSPVNGISLAKESKSDHDMGRTGTQVVADRMNERLNQQANQICVETFAGFKTAKEAADSPEARILIDAIYKSCGSFWYAGKESLNDRQIGLLNVAFSEALYGYLVQSAMTRQPLSARKVRGFFLQRLDMNQFSPNQQQYLQSDSEKHSNFAPDSLRGVVLKAGEITGLAISFKKGFENGKRPGESFVDLIKEG